MKANGNRDMGGNDRWKILNVFEQPANIMRIPFFKQRQVISPYCFFTLTLDT